MTEHYEKVRAAALAPDGSLNCHWGQAVLLGRGLAAWIQAVGQAWAPLRPLPVAASSVSQVLPARVRRDLICLMGEAVLTLLQNPPIP